MSGMAFCCGRGFTIIVLPVTLTLTEKYVGTKPTLHCSPFKAIYFLPAAMAKVFVPLNMLKGLELELEFGPEREV